MVHTEYFHQRALCDWWAIACKKYKIPEMLLHHSPNGVNHTKVTGHYLGTMGMRKGFPDLVLFVPRGGHGALAIELKSEQGRPTREQMDYLDALKAQGYVACVCRGWEEARDTIIEYLGS